MRIRKARGVIAAQVTPTPSASRYLILFLQCPFVILSINSGADYNGLARLIESR